MILCLTAYGDYYNTCLKNFLKTDFSKNFTIYIQTDTPEDYSNYNTNFYYKPVFNYFDKITYGLSVINKLKKPGFIWDADELIGLEELYSMYDLTSNKIQFYSYWNEIGTYDTRLPEHKYGWPLFDDMIKQENILEKEIFMIGEDRLFFPNLNYTDLIYYFEKLRFQFITHTLKNGMHKNGVGNGEGLALGYALYKTGLPFARVV